LIRGLTIAPRRRAYERATTGCEVSNMKWSWLVVLAPLALAGCLSFSSSNPPPPSHTTVVVPPAAPAQ
jgi:hypothetical protein